MSPTLRDDNELLRYLYPFFEKQRKTLVGILGFQTLDDKSKV